MKQRIKIPEIKTATLGLKLCWVEIEAGRPMLLNLGRVFRQKSKPGHAAAPGILFAADELPKPIFAKWYLPPGERLPKPQKSLRIPATWADMFRLLNNATLETIATKRRAASVELHSEIELRPFSADEWAQWCVAWRAPEIVGVPWKNRAAAVDLMLQNFGIANPHGLWFNRPTAFRDLWKRALRLTEELSKILE